MADSANLFMATAALTQSAGAFANAYTQSQALEVQGQYQQQQFDMNSKLAAMQAQDAVDRGDKAASAVRKLGRRTIGAQRASYAAQGVDVGVGSALTVQYDTKKLSELDAMQIKNNAWQEAWGYKMQALDLSFRGQFAKSAADFEAKSTLLSGGLNALSYGLQSAGYVSNYLGGGRVPIRESSVRRDSGNTVVSSNLFGRDRRTY